MSDKFLSKQRNAASRVSLTKQPVKWSGADPCGPTTTPAKQLRNTTFIFPAKGGRGISKPE